MARQGHVKVFHLSTPNTPHRHMSKVYATISIESVPAYSSVKRTCFYPPRDAIVLKVGSAISPYSGRNCDAERELCVAQLAPVLCCWL